MKILVFAAATFGLSGLAAAHEVVHNAHNHAHASDCGHQMVAHDGHMDAVHDGHLHHTHDGHVDEHTVAVSDTNPDGEVAGAHSKGHDHNHGSADCAHQMVPHGQHQDALHDGHLHHQHDDHVDEHGKV